MTSVAARGKRWWSIPEADKADVAGALFAQYRKARNSMQKRRRLDRQHMEMYSNLDVSGDGYGSADAARMGGRMRYNVCQSIVDTAASVIAQQRPKPQYLTTDGDFSLQRQARLRTQVLEGQLYETGAYEIMPRVFLDAAVVGTGVVYGYLGKDGCPKLERVCPLEVWVDKSEAIYGRPRTFYRTHLMLRDDLEELYPDAAAAIAKCSSLGSEERADLWLRADPDADQLLVVESWRTACASVGETRADAAERKTDGRHVLAINGTTLVDEEWEHERPPLVFYRWSERQLGFWGCGLVERAKDAQWRINRLIAMITDLSNLASNLHIFVEKNSGFKVESLTNEACKIYRYTGQPPIFHRSEAVPQELFAQLDREREQIFAQEGVSQMQSEGKKPTGLDSAPAQRTHDDLQTRRHVMNARAYENAYMDVVRLLELLNEEAYSNDNGYAIQSRTRRGAKQLVRQVNWGEVRMPEAKYRLQMFPTSALPTTPEGKTQTVQEWIAAGFITPPFAQQLLDFPDIDASTRLQIADLDYAMWQVEQILDGYDVTPIPQQDLKLAADIARKSLMQVTIDGAPEDVLEALRQHAQACVDLTNTANGAPANAQTAVPGAPATPLAPPDLGPGAVPPMPTGGQESLIPAA